MKKYCFVETRLSLALTVLVLKRFDACREVIEQRGTSAGLCSEVSVEDLAGLTIRLLLILHTLFYELRPHGCQLLFPGLFAGGVQFGLFLIPVPVSQKVGCSREEKQKSPKDKNISCTNTPHYNYLLFQ
jgi:hypothetical protein